MSTIVSTYNHPTVHGEAIARVPVLLDGEARETSHGVDVDENRNDALRVGRMLARLPETGSRGRCPRPFTSPEQRTAKSSVVLQGVGVVPGQYVFADSSGAALIPDGELDEVLAKARDVEGTDAASRDQDRPRAGSRERSTSATNSPRPCSTRGAAVA